MFVPARASRGAGVLAALTLLSGVWNFGAASAPEACAPLHARNPDGNYIVPGVLGDIEYSPGLALDAYVQAGDRRRASVVVIHGGGWTSGSRSALVGKLLELLTRAGYHWFSVDYRLGGLSRYEESLADVRTAVGFIRCRARELGIDPRQLVLLGEDTGADLAALLAAERPEGVIGTILIGGRYDAPRLSAATPPIPSLVVHGAADAESPIERARQFCASAAERAASCRFVVVAGASHRSENWWPRQWG